MRRSRERRGALPLATDACSGGGLVASPLRPRGPRPRFFVVLIIASAWMRTAHADPPPNLHALLTCDPPGGHFMMKTRESAWPFDDTSDSTADPAATVRFDLGQHKPYACRLPGFVIDVRTEDYQLGGDLRVECAIWDKGSFVIRINHHSYATIRAPYCSDEVRHDIDIQVKNTPGGGHQLWSVDCAYGRDIANSVCVNLPRTMQSISSGAT